MRKLKIAIIGCGAILQVHLDSIVNFKSAELIAVCDIKEELAKSVAEKYKCKWFINYEDLLTNEEIDVVHILTPHYLHTPMTIKAIEHGKHVVLEKPVGINFDELKILREKAQENNLTIGVILQNRFNPTTVKMKEIIDSGVLGKLISSKGILTWCRKEDYYKLSEWRGKLATEGGGLLINQAIHTLDLLEYIGGKVKTIKANIVNNTHPEIEVEDTAVITMYYESGAVGIFFGTNCYGENSNIEMGFIFENGKLLLRDQKLYFIKDGQSQLIAKDITTKDRKSYWGMSHQLIIRDIYEAILLGKEPTVTLDDGIRATELVLLSYSKNV